MGTGIKIILGLLGVVLILIALFSILGVFKESVYKNESVTGGVSSSSSSSSSSGSANGSTTQGDDQVIPPGDRAQGDDQVIPPGDREGPARDDPAEGEP